VVVHLPEWYATYAGWKDEHHGAEQENVAHILDELHIAKIERYQCILVVNANGYIGDRTSMEIKFATEIKKPVFYWQE
jgi:hypothetical protein